MKIEDIKDDKVRALAIKNLEQSDWEYSEILTKAFEFEKTPEGYDFWTQLVIDFKYSK